MTYLRYAPNIERPTPDEQETIDGIIKGMTQQSQTVEKREHHAVRAQPCQELRLRHRGNDRLRRLAPGACAGTVRQTGYTQGGRALRPGPGRDAR